MLQIPTSLCITPDSSRESLENILPGIELTCRDAVVLYLVLTRLAVEGSNTGLTTHGPYIRVLPKQFDTPLHFTEQELTLLTGTSLAFSAEKRLHETKGAAERVYALLPRSVAVPTSEWLALWRWADDVYGRCAFCSQPELPRSHLRKIE